MSTRPGPARPATVCNARRSLARSGVGGHDTRRTSLSRPYKSLQAPTRRRFIRPYSLTRPLSLSRSAYSGIIAGRWVCVHVMFSHSLQLKATKRSAPPHDKPRHLSTPIVASPAAAVTTPPLRRIIHDTRNAMHQESFPQNKTRRHSGVQVWNRNPRRRENANSLVVLVLVDAKNVHLRPSINYTRPIH